MRGMGWSLIIVLVAAGWLLEAIGESAFTVLVWVLIGIAILWQVLGLLAKMGLIRPPAVTPPGQLSPEDERQWQRSNQRRENGLKELLLAVEQRDGPEVERLVLREKVSPFETASLRGDQRTSANALAIELNYVLAMRFFEEWKQKGQAARIER